MPIQLVARPRVHLARQGDGHVGVGGFAHYHQARGAGRDAQEFGLLRGGQAGFDRVLRLPQRGHGAQVVGGRELGEVIVQVVGCAGRVDGPDSIAASFKPAKA